MLIAGANFLTGCGGNTGSGTSASKIAGTPSAVATPLFDGKYKLLPEKSFPVLRADPEFGRLVDQFNVPQFENMQIQHGVLHSGSKWRQELLIHTATTTEGKLVGTALFHEDVHDPGDAGDIGIELEWIEGLLHLRLVAEGTAPDTIVYERLKTEGN